MSVYPQAIYTRSAAVKSFSMVMRAREAARAMSVHLHQHIPERWLRQSPMMPQQKSENALHAVRQTLALAAPGQAWRFAFVNSNTFSLIRRFPGTSFSRSSRCFCSLQSVVSIRQGVGLHWAFAVLDPCSNPSILSNRLCCSLLKSVRPLAYCPMVSLFTQSAGRVDAYVLGIVF